MSKNQQTVAEVLASMLTENTGRALLDSGDYYGRNWQRNAGKKVADFEARQPARTEFSVRRGKMELSITLDVFHWLKDKLDSYEPRLDRIFGMFAERGENRNQTWLQIAEEFPAWLAKRLGAVRGEEVDVGDLYGGEGVTVINTYNGEDLLSQIIQYVYFTLDGESYVLLQIHGGCDARGGYTRPRVFSTDEKILDNDHCTVYCDGSMTIMRCPDGHRVEKPSWQVDIKQIEMCPVCLKPMMFAKEEPSRHFWDSTNGGYSLEPVDGESRLERCPVVVLEDDDERKPEQVWEAGKLVIDSRERTGYCPECGGRLHAASF